jgi:hypothetical protein
MGYVYAEEDYTRWVITQVNMVVMKQQAVFCFIFFFFTFYVCW